MGRRRFLFGGGSDGLARALSLWEKSRTSAVIGATRSAMSSELARLASRPRPPEVEQSPEPDREKEEVT